MEIKDCYTYLGLLFNYNGNFFQARKKLVDQAQKALYDLDSQKDITQPDNPLHWPKGAVKDIDPKLSHDEPKEKKDLEELELLQKNPLISNQIIHKRVPGKNSLHLLPHIICDI